MEKETILVELKNIFEKLGVEVKEQELMAYSERAKSGLVRVKNKRMVFLESELSIEEKIKILLQFLREFDLEQVFISPFIRDLIENEDGEKF